MEQQAPLFPVLLILIVGAVTLVLLAFWIWMLVDCIQNEPTGGNDKIIWILVILLAGWIGAIVYYFVRRAPRLR